MGRARPAPASGRRAGRGLTDRCSAPETGSRAARRGRARDRSRPRRRRPGTPSPPSAAAGRQDDRARPPRLCRAVRGVRTRRREVRWPADRARPRRRARGPDRRLAREPIHTGTEKLVLRFSFEPASAFILGYAETLGHIDGGGNQRQARRGADARGVLAWHATRSQTFAAGVPDAIHRRALLPLGALLGRLRRYELHTPP